VLNLNLLTTKTHYLAQNHVVWCIKRENRSNGLVCGARKNWKKCSKHSKVLGDFAHVEGAKTPGRIDPQIFLMVYVPDLITCFKFRDDRFGGLASAESQILPFPIDSDGRPYNTLTLPCERVMYCNSSIFSRPY